ncbi:MAG: 30S ribosomal protein S5 [Candidatus Anstonellales archaeon]
MNENEEMSQMHMQEAKTKLGRAVRNGEITNIDEILTKRKPILETWIVDALLPDLKSQTIELRTTQRVTDSGRKISYRAVVIVGSDRGYIGLGSGKAQEPALALSKALDKAKRSIIKVNKGCGSWECQCGTEHSIPKLVRGKESSTYIVLKPAPKGVGLAVNDTIKNALSIAGIKDVWGKARGATGNVYNTLLATIKALDKLNEY